MTILQRTAPEVAAVPAVAAIPANIPVSIPVSTPVSTPINTPEAESWRLWLRRHWLSVTVLTVALVIVGAATAWNLQGWPARVNDDEGTYVAQAWALLFGLSPLAIYYHRMVSLDNIATMWLLSALAIAASRRHSLAAAFWSGVCCAAAVLSKETIAVLLPSVLWLLWQHTGKGTRRWNLGTFAVTFTLLVLVYPLFAVLRGELIPGRGMSAWPGHCGGSSSPGQAAEACLTARAALSVWRISGSASTLGSCWQAARWCPPDCSSAGSGRSGSPWRSR